MPIPQEDGEFINNYLGHFGLNGNRDIGTLNHFSKSIQVKLVYTYCNVSDINNNTRLQFYHKYCYIQLKFLKVD